MSVQITQGTQTPIYTKLGQGTEVQVIKLDVGSGTAFADFGGTIAEVANLAKGTITSVANIAGGTVRIDSTPVNSSLIMGTLGTALINVTYWKGT